MLKKRKKLTLSREVLHRLTEDGLTKVVGGCGCTLFCNDPNSGYIECQPNYTCWQGCIPL